MARLPEHVLRCVREIEAELGTLVDGGPGAMEVLAPAIGTAVHARISTAFAFGARGRGLKIDRGAAHGCPPSFLTVFDQFLDGKTIGWTGYNPIRPEPVQRNAALSTAQIFTILQPRDARELPVVRDYFPKVGVAQCDCLRVLVCEGSSLLAWVGAFREEPFDDRERRTLQRLVPAMQRRLLTERRLTTEPGARALFAAAFAAIPAPSFVTDAHGTLLETNAPGELWLAREGLAGREALRAAVKRDTQRPASDPRWSVTRVAAPGTPDRRLLVLRPGAEHSAALRAASAAAIWRLTPRQAAVLGLLVEGVSNRTIAAELAVSERAVEAHLGVIFEKAQVECRTEVVAAVWKVTGG